MDKHGVNAVNNFFNQGGGGGALLVSGRTPIIFHVSQRFPIGWIFQHAALSHGLEDFILALSAEQRIKEVFIGVAGFASRVAVFCSHDVSCIFVLFFQSFSVV